MIDRAGENICSQKRKDHCLGLSFSLTSLELISCCRELIVADHENQNTRSQIQYIVYRSVRLMPHPVRPISSVY